MVMAETIRPFLVSAEASVRVIYLIILYGN
jgi:hypothetical protein